MNLLQFALLIIGMLVSINNPVAQEDPLYEKANELAQKFIIVDGHIDLPYRLSIQNFRFTRELIGIPIQTDEGDFDYVRAKAGGLDAPFMSIYIPASYQENGNAKAYADSLIDMVQGIIAAHPDKFAAATGPDDIITNFQQGRMSLPLGMENGAPLEDDLDNVAYFKNRGICYITLTHSKNNQICDSSYDPERMWNGLSPFGVEVVREMNRLGIMIDISHVSDSTFYQVMDLSEVPVIASHSSSRYFTPDFERNMDDNMIQLLKQKGGVIMINFGSSFLDEKIILYRQETKEKLNALLEAEGLTRSDPAAQDLIEQFGKENPALFADVDKVADHIDHVVKIAGVEVVGFGSDFDGVGDSLPTGLKDVSQYPNLIYTLLKRGYSESDIEKMCSGNLLRVWRQVDAYQKSY